MLSVHIIVFEEIATVVIWLLSHKRFQKVPFSPSTLTYLAGVFKFIHFAERSRKVPFSVTVNAVLVWTEGLSGEKKVPFIKFIRLTVDVALINKKVGRRVTPFCIQDLL